MPKSIFTILVTLLVLALAGASAWFFFFYEAPDKEFDATPAVSDFLPFGKLREEGTQGTAEPGRGAEQGTTEGQRSFGPLTELVSAPIAGFTALPGATTTVRYMERATGHVYDIALASGEETRITNTTIPRVYEALFADGGASVLVRYLRDDNETIETYSAKIEKDEGGTATELKGVFLPPGIKELVVSPDGKKIFYLTAFAGGTAGFTAAPGNTGRVQVWGSLANEWLAGWTSEKNIIVTTKPSDNVAGFSYKIDPITKTAERVVGGIPGLTALISPDGKSILYGTAANASIGVGLYDEKTAEFSPLTLGTFPEKCAWGKNGKFYCGVPSAVPRARYPDAWYQGLVLFSDRIWAVDVSTNTNVLLSDLSQTSGNRIDVIKPALSSDGKYLFFMNKKDQSLWSLALPE